MVYEQSMNEIICQKKHANACFFNVLEAIKQLQFSHNGVRTGLLLQTSLHHQ